MGLDVVSAGQKLGLRFHFLRWLVSAFLYQAYARKYLQVQRTLAGSREGAQDTFDSGGYVALLARLLDSYEKETVYAPEFIREIEEPIANSIEILPTTRLIITEGNYLLLLDGAWANVRGYLDESWYINVDSSIRTERLVKRHEFFGRSHQSALDWVEQTDEPNARLIEATKDKADLVFDWG